MTHRITDLSVQPFDWRAWANEGDGLLASAKQVREYWLEHKQTFHETIQDRKSGLRDAASDWNLLEGLPRSSMLLLGYSVEMYLKAGLAKAYLGCPEEMFERDVKIRFGHKLMLLAREIAFEFLGGDEGSFDSLQKMVLVDARYPIYIPDDQSFAETKNSQTRRIWSTENFDTLYALVERVREHARLIDSDEKNPVSYYLYKVDQDGFFAFRIGGRLPPRITYRMSSLQRDNGETSEDDMRTLFPSFEFAQLDKYWNEAEVFEDQVTPRPRTIKLR